MKENKEIGTDFDHVPSGAEVQPKDPRKEAWARTENEEIDNELRATQEESSKAFVKDNTPQRVEEELSRRSHPRIVRQMFCKGTLLLN